VRPARTARTVRLADLHRTLARCTVPLRTREHAVGACCRLTAREPGPTIRPVVTAQHSLFRRGLGIDATRRRIVLFVERTRLPLRVASRSAARDRSARRARRVGDFLPLAEGGIRFRRG
jgi:hypothetical protein